MQPVSPCLRRWNLWGEAEVLPGVHIIPMGRGELLGYEARDGRLGFETEGSVGLRTEPGGVCGLGERLRAGSTPAAWRILL